MKLVRILVGVIFAIAIYYPVSGTTNAIKKMYVFMVSNINSETVGEIVTSEIIKSGKGRSHSISYKYQINGKDYLSNLVSFSSNINDEHKYVSRYPAGKKVVVFYSSEAPKFSILERTNPDLTVLFQALSVLFVSIFFGSVFSIIVIDIYLSRMRKK